MKQVAKRIINTILITTAILVIGYITLTVVFSFQGVYFSFSFPKPGWRVWEPTWSPAGDFIAFRCIYISSENWNLDTYELTMASDLCVTDDNGKQFQILTSGGGLTGFAWSPNGKSLAWAHESDFTWESVAIWSTQELAVETFSLLDEIEWSGGLNWSKDGKKLFLGKSDAVFNIANKELLPPLPLEVDGEEFFGFTRSLDGEYLALERYVTFPDGLPDLIITTNSKVTYIGYEFVRGCIYSWSPNDNILAWTGSPTPKDPQNPKENWEYDITELFFTFAPTGETIKYDVTGNLLLEHSDIVWSPNGRNLAISKPGSAFVEILEFASSENGFPLAITHSSQLSLRKPRGDYLYVNGKLSWSPDGKYLIFESDEKIWLVNTKDSKTQELLIDFP